MLFGFTMLLLMLNSNSIVCDLLTKNRKPLKKWNCSMYQKQTPSRLFFKKNGHRFGKNVIFSDYFLVNKVSKIFQRFSAIFCGANIHQWQVKKMNEHTHKEHKSFIRLHLGLTND